MYKRLRVQHSSRRVRASALLPGLAIASSITMPSCRINPNGSTADHRDGRLLYRPLVNGAR